MNPERSILAKTEMQKLTPADLEKAKREKEHREREPVNDGAPPITARKHLGETERNPFCEDMKIKDTKRKLFLVADGVSGGVEKSGGGAIAARLLAESVQEIVGDPDVDKDIANLIAVNAKRKQHDLDIIVRRHIQTVMEAAIRQAEVEIQAIRTAHPKYKDAATTASLAKMVEMPNGDINLYYTNVGDSRQYLLHDGVLTKLTVDDSYASAMIRHHLGLDHSETFAPNERQAKEEEFKQHMDALEQAQSAETAQTRFAELYRFRNIIVRAVGPGKFLTDKILQPEDHVEVKMMKLKAGDRYLNASDGVTDVAFESEIQNMLHEHPDDREAEDVLQNNSDEIALYENHPRAKADDISAIVYTVPDRTRNKSVEKEALEKTDEQPVVNDRPKDEDVLRWKESVPMYDQAITDLLQEMKRVTEPLERAELEIRLADLEIGQAQLEYWIAKGEKMRLDENVPHRFAKGQPVRLPSDDTHPGSEGWTVSDYKGDTEVYLVMKGGESRIMDRYTLELAQSELPVQKEDSLTIQRVAQSVRAFIEAAARHRMRMEDAVRRLPDLEQRKQAAIEQRDRIQQERARGSALRQAK